MPENTWWKNGIIYQIYPRSFQDTDGDGIGDLEGIRQRLDYLSWLGVDAIWISPIYPSPMADFGYDVADYCGVDSIFGSLEDFDRMLEEAHRRRLKVILDFVPNHTSDRHPWFQESRASRKNPKRDWYIWRDPAPDGGPPNNWLSNFGGSGWQKDDATGQYYYHAFLKEQPDLNWRNPAVRAAMYDVLRFWMNRGVDGFRVDVIWHLMKDPEFRDNPANPGYAPHQPEIDRLLQVHSADHPDILPLLKEMRKTLDAFPDRVLIGEIYLPLERLVAYYGDDLSGAHLPFNFQLLQTPWNARRIAELVREYDSALPNGGWPNWVLGNHDKPRIKARIGAEQARVAAMLLLTLRGTPTLYYGDEIGIGHVSIPPDRVQDPWERNEPGLGFGRDPQRTPMHWDRSSHAGFSTGTPWLPLADNHAECNVETMSRDPGSILNLYRRLIQLRREHRALSIGHYAAVATPEDQDVFAYERHYGGDSLGVALNLNGNTEQVPWPWAARVVLSTCGDRTGTVFTDTVELRPNEGVILMPVNA
jgi:alpha-glucosidase